MQTPIQAFANCKLELLMIEHKYILEPYKGMNTRYRCPAPNCGKGKTFSLYIDTETGEHIHPTVGRCNRESNCGYHYTPKQYFQDNNISFDKPQPKAYKPRPVTPQPKPISFIPVEVFKQSLQIDKIISQVAENNHFIKFLINLFGVEIANELISRFFIGTSKYWNGATAFWQIDTQGKVRTGKIMLYCPSTGKRQKDFTFVHKLIKQPEFGLKQCFFGEHLLIDETKPVAIVESEKTAVIASVYLPQFIWVASSGLHGLNIDKCRILKGRTVTLFPDLSKPKIEGKPTAFEIWSSKAKELSHLANFSVSDLLEYKATEPEKKQGLDLADYLMKFDYKKFVLPNPEKPTKPNTLKRENTPEPLNSLQKYSSNETSKKPIEKKCYILPKTITALESYFDNIQLPKEPIKLNNGSLITDCTKFIDSHLSTIKANRGNKTFLPFLNRLEELKAILLTAIILLYTHVY